MIDWKLIIKRILGIANYDREGERLIYKSIKIFHKGGKINYFRGVRLYNKIQQKYGCSVWPGIKLGNGTYIAHMHNIYIGKTCEIGNNCKIYPGATVVAALKGDRERIRLHEKLHAVIGDDCLLGAGCILVGPIHIGDDVTIAAGAVVTKDVPPHTVVKNTNQFRIKRYDEISEKYREEIQELEPE